jgi:hypothetical protein
MRVKRTNSEELSDTLSSAINIPIISTLEIKQNIYTDGTFSFTSIDHTPKDEKYIETLNVNPQLEDEKIYKTKIIRNIAYQYNSSGKLLYSKSIGNMNFKQILDSIQVHIASQKDSSNSSQKVRAHTNLKLISAKNSGMRVIVQNENEIVLEKDLGYFQSSISKNIKSHVLKKVVMHFSPDMTRMSSQKTYEGTQLVQAIEIGYSSTNNEQFANSIFGVESTLLQNANIKYVKQKSLNLKYDGTPIVLNNNEIYQKNIINFKLNTIKN